MFIISKVAVWTLFFAEIFAYTGFLREHVKYYSESWIVLVSDGEEIVRNITQRRGFDIVEPLSFYPQLYHIKHQKHPKRSKYENQYLTKTLLRHSQILWTEQLAYIQHELKYVKCPAMIQYGKAQYEKAFPDKLFSQQWYLQECRSSTLFPMYDLNVFPVWYKHKIFGKNIKLLFIDDGVDHAHLDLRDNYICRGNDPLQSEPNDVISMLPGTEYNRVRLKLPTRYVVRNEKLIIPTVKDKSLGFDYVDGDNDPTPVSTHLKPYAHGTKCAGIVSMRAGNQICGVGIAPLATFGAVRLIGPGALETDKTDANAFLFKFEEFDIISNSWGPDDDGQTMEPMGKLLRLAFKLGIILGRQGKGIIYVFPAGNGRKKQDSCGADALVNSIYTIAVAGVDYDGRITWYSERCAAIMATAYGGNKPNKMDHNIVSTTTRNKCTTSMYGTSAAVPLASGIISLMLEAKGDLTWRGVQHAIVYTAQVAPLATNPVWRINGAGFIVGHNFGFGMLDALRMVEFAQTMEPLPPMNSCILRLGIKNTSFDRKRILQISFKTNACQSLPSEINYIEHVQLMVSAQYTMRGAIKINLFSPAKTLSHMLESRKRDKSKNGLKNWIMDSVHMWGESPRGEWILKFIDITGQKSYSGFVQSVALIIHGTKTMPPHYHQRRTYNKFTIKVETSDVPFIFPT